MEFNANECKVLRVAHRRSIIKKDYHLGGTKLDCIDVEKDLGVLVSHDLSWNNHADLSSKAQYIHMNIYPEIPCIPIL